MAAPAGFVRVNPLSSKACFRVLYSLKLPSEALPVSLYTMTSVPVLSTVTWFPFTVAKPSSSPVTVAPPSAKVTVTIRVKVVLEMSSSEDGSPVLSKT